MRIYKFLTASVCAYNLANWAQGKGRSAAVPSVLDLSDPRNPHVISPQVEDPIELNDSVTLQQLSYERPLFRRLSPQGETWKSRLADVRCALVCRFLIFNPQTRGRVEELVKILVSNEIDAKGNVIAYHGTHQTASMIFRTALADQSAASGRRTVELRDPQVHERLANYPNVARYYEEREKKARETLVRVPYPSSPALGIYDPRYTEEPGIFDDRLDDIRAALLSANHGFFGQSFWLKHGWHESSAVFLGTSVSRWYQVWDSAPLWVRPETALLGVYVGIKCLLNPHISVSELIDTYGKGFQSDRIFENIFKSYGAEELYPKYKEELQRLRYSFPPAILQCVIPRDLADKYCYLSRATGLKVDTEVTVAEIQMDPFYRECLPYNQIRLLLHPRLREGMQIHMYTLGSSPEILAATKRLEEIAQEVAQKKGE